MSSDSFYDPGFFLPENVRRSYGTTPCCLEKARHDIFLYIFFECCIYIFHTCIYIYIYSIAVALESSQQVQCLYPDFVATKVLRLGFACCRTAGPAIGHGSLMGSEYLVNISVARWQLQQGNPVATWHLSYTLRFARQNRVVRNRMNQSYGCAVCSTWLCDTNLDPSAKI